MLKAICQKAICLLSAAAVSIALFACSEPESSHSAKVNTDLTLQLRWKHQAQFAGFYVADQMHLYRQQGLNVSFIEGGPLILPTKVVNDGVAQFGIATPNDLVVARAHGAKVRAIAAIYRINPMVLYSLKSLGVQKPADLVGKTIHVPATADIFFKTFIAKTGIHPAAVTQTVLDSGDPFAVLRNEKDVMVGFFMNQVRQLQRAGYEINVIYPDDYGVHFYGDVLFTTDAYLNDHFNEVVAFLRASLLGWEHALVDPVQAARFVRHYNASADLAHEIEFLDASVPLITAGDYRLGWMQESAWDATVQVLYETHMLPVPIPSERVYTNKVLEEIAATP